MVCDFFVIFPQEHCYDSRFFVDEQVRRQILLAAKDKEQKGGTLDPVEAEYAGFFNLTQDEDNEHEDDEDDVPSDLDMELELSGALAVTPAVLEDPSVSLVKKLTGSSTVQKTLSASQKKTVATAKNKQAKGGMARICKSLILQK